MLLYKAHIWEKSGARDTGQNALIAGFLTMSLEQIDEKARFLYVYTNSWKLKVDLKCVE